MTPPSTWIVNASPFIGLAKAGIDHLLLAPGRILLMPLPVAKEIQAGSSEDPAVWALTTQAAVLTLLVLPPSPVNPQVASLHLDAGEAAVLTEALAHPGSMAVIDDGEGRRAAMRLGVPLIGSVGVLALARREGRLPELAPAVRALQSAGLFLPSETVLRGLLQPFGENWP